MFEISSTDCYFMVLGKDVLVETEENGGFSDARVAKEDDFGL